MIDAQLLALLVEMAALEAQAARGVGDVAAVGAQALADRLALVGVDEIAQRAVERRRAAADGGRAGQRRAHVGGGDGVGVGEDQHALDDVAQLAHVAFPRLFLEEGKRFRGEPPGAPVMAMHGGGGEVGGQGRDVLRVLPLP